MLKVLDIEINDRESTWQPEDPNDFDEWVTVNIGEKEAGNLYQIHLCTAISIRRLDVKRNLFMLEQWISLDDIIEKINVFIQETTESGNFSLSLGNQHIII